MAGTCTFCGKAIDANSDYQKVVGWEKKRSGGGTNAVRGRENVDEWACRWCVDKLAKGIDPGQQGLL